MSATAESPLATTRRSLYAVAEYRATGTIRLAVRPGRPEHAVVDFCRTGHALAGQPP